MEFVYFGKRGYTGIYLSCLIKMTKKEYVLRLLTALEGKWDLAAGLKFLVEGDDISDSLLDSLQSTFSSAIDEITDEDAKQILQTSHDFLEKLKHVEFEQKQKDDTDIADLDAMLQTL